MYHPSNWKKPTQPGCTSIFLSLIASMFLLLLWVRDLVNPTCGQYLIAGEALGMCSEWLTGLAWFPWGLTSAYDAHRFFLLIKINLRLEVLEKITYLGNASAFFWKKRPSEVFPPSHSLCLVLFLFFNLFALIYWTWCKLVPHTLGGASWEESQGQCSRKGKNSQNASKEAPAVSLRSAGLLGSAQVFPRSHFFPLQEK